MPRLSFFITEHSHEILDAWEAFARELPATKRMDVATLRDHAQRMLDAIVAALEAPQREEQRDRKLREREDAHGETLTAASEHGRCRAEHGYSNDSTLAEFRALRASVIRLWLKHQHDVGRAELEEMRRFNEAIDEAIAESLAQYSADVNDARDRILAILGHDLRTPVNAMLISSRVLLAESEGGNASHELLDVIERSAHRMTHLINDLLDLAWAVVETRCACTAPARISVRSCVRSEPRWPPRRPVRRSPSRRAARSSANGTERDWARRSRIFSATPSRMDRQASRSL
jgi:signal transduction histidine kinase